MSLNLYCIDCKFYEEGGGGLGRCKRFPPVYVATPNELGASDEELPTSYSQWSWEQPVVEGTEDGCGEFVKAKSSNRK